MAAALAAAHGFPATAYVAEEAGVPLDPGLHVYAYGQIGNCMSVSNVGSVMAVVLACLARK